MMAKIFQFRLPLTALIAFTAICTFLPRRIETVVSAEVDARRIESATYVRGEFFGAEALIPLPPAAARDNLLRLSAEMPDRVDVLENLAAVEEKLGNFDPAENALVRLSELDAAKENLTAFYHRRGRFTDEAKILRRMLASAPPEDRPAAFERLFELARKHDLHNFKSLEFLREVANENTDVFEVFDRLIDRLAIEKDSVAALEFLRQAKLLFPGKSEDLLEREIEMLTQLRRGDEAERIYLSAFDPFWSEERSDAFYRFLSDRDHLREYGAELKTKFKANPGHFDTAIRYACHRSHSYEEITPVILKLEKSKIDWTTDELLIVTRLLIREDNGDLASRFLYTLYNRLLSEPGTVVTGFLETTPSAEAASTPPLKL